MTGELYAEDRLAAVRRAIDAAYAYVDLGSVTIADAVEVACDYEGVPLDQDRRVVRNAVERRVAIARMEAADLRRRA